MQASLEADGFRDAFKSHWRKHTEKQWPDTHLGLSLWKFEITSLIGSLTRQILHVLKQMPFITSPPPARAVYIGRREEEDYSLHSDEQMLFLTKEVDVDMLYFYAVSR